jgi:hypothetical protein
LRYSEACRGCKGIKECRNKPSTAELIKIICPACDGEGCEECRNGEINITDCPLLLITRDVWDLIRYAELFEKGLPPIAGGVLQQADIFIQAAEFYFGEKQYWKNRAGLN